MLKIINLNKTYKSKSGAACQALKNLNLEINQKGFVFILGKSGCGKSTLLNVLGGLDSFDRGDIVIKNKSSSNFKASEWDSYRNTYVGFVFQDFNLIENYTVAKNISLALELQGIKKKDIEPRVKEILRKVGLEDYGNRKPNELSGGQKQRIAIARALVKNPEIILADEPTGNLDSTTSEQIIKILRKLAEEKLVIMVSHDEDIAYKYADRIITMSDGNILSDQYNDGLKKRKNPAKESIKKITSPFKLIKSKLPIKNSIKLALSAIWQKKIRLCFTLLLFFLALTLFGFSETVNHFDFAQAITNSYVIGDIAEVSLSNRENVTGWGNATGGEEANMPFELEKVETVMAQYPRLTYAKLYDFPHNEINIDFTATLVAPKTLKGFLELEQISDVNLEIAEGEFPKNNTEIMLTDFVVDYLIQENEDYNNYSDLISEEYLVDGESYIIAGVAKTDYKDYLYLNNLPTSQLNDLTAEVDKYNTGHNNKYARIIVNNGFYAENYKVINVFDAYGVFIQKKDSENEEDIDLISDSFFSFDEEILNHPYRDQFLFVPEGFKGLGENEIIVSSYSLAGLNYLDGAEWIYKIINDGIRDGENIFDLLFEENLIPDEIEISIVSNEVVRINKKSVNVTGVIDFEKYRQFLNSDKMYEYALENGSIFTTEDIEAFNIDGGYYHYKTVIEYLRIQLEKAGIDVFTEEEFRQIQQGDYNEYIKELAEDNQVTVTVGHLKIQLEKAGIDVFTEEEFNNQTGNQTIQGDYNEYIKELAEDNQVTATTEYLRIKLEEKGLELLTEEDFNQTERGDYMGYLNGLDEDNQIVVPNLYSQVQFPVIMNKEEFSDLNPYNINKVQNILVLLTDDTAYNQDFFADINKMNYQHNTLSGITLGLIDDAIDSLSNVFRYVSLVLAVFVIIVMFSNISASVLDAKKEIGTLRAIGARGRDVAMIFIIEAVILAAITSVFAIWVLVSITQKLNNYLTSQIDIPLTIFNPSILIFGELVLLALVVAIVASFIPVKRVSLMKPIDAIKNK